MGKRSRVELAEAYRRRYLYEVLDQVDLDAVLESLPGEATSALLCGERDARACHRSLIAARLQAQYEVPVLNLSAPRRCAGSGPSQRTGEGSVSTSR